MSYLEDAEKQFIVKESIADEELKDLLVRLSNFCKIDVEGRPIMTANNFSLANKIMLMLSSRYLARLLHERLARELSFEATINLKDLTTFLHEAPDVVSARLKELKDKNKVAATEKGVYKVLPYAIKQLLDELEVAKK